MIENVFFARFVSFGEILYLCSKKNDGYGKYHDSLEAAGS